MQVGDLVAKKLDEPQRLLGVVVAREQSGDDRFADAIIVREYSGRMSRWGEAWLEVLSEGK